MDQNLRELTRALRSNPDDPENIQRQIRALVRSGKAKGVIDDYAKRWKGRNYGKDERNLFTLAELEHFEALQEAAYQPQETLHAVIKCHTHLSGYFWDFICNMTMGRQPFREKMMLQRLTDLKKINWVYEIQIQEPPPEISQVVIAHTDFEHDWPYVERIERLTVADLEGNIGINATQSVSIQSCLCKKNMEEFWAAFWDKYGELQRVGQAFYNHFGLRPMIFGDNHPTITALLLEEDENRAITMINDLVKKMEKYNIGEMLVGHTTISDKIAPHWQQLWRAIRE